MLTGTEAYQSELFQLRWLASCQTFQHLLFFTEDQDAQQRDVGPDFRSSEGFCIGACVTHVSLI